MDPKSGRFWLVVLVLGVGGGLYLFTSGACEEAREAVDNTADAITGNQAIQVGEHLKEELEDIRNIQIQRNEQLKSLPER